MKNKQLGQDFFLLAKVRKRGVIIYVKQELQPKLRFTDGDGRLLGVEIILEGKKVLLIGVYAPNWAKKKNLSLKQKLEQEIYDQIMMGDYNGVVNPIIDKSPGKKGGSCQKYSLT